VVKNLHNSKRNHNPPRRTNPTRRRPSNDDEEVDEPDQGFNNRRNKVEGGFQFCGGEEADFEQGQDDG
jgi:hypothetical protein